MDRIGMQNDFKDMVPKKHHVEISTYFEIKKEHVDPVSITKPHLFKYIENFTTKKGKFSDKKKICYFSYFCSKHRLCVLLGTTSARRF